LNAQIINELKDRNEATFKFIYNSFKEKIYRTACMLTNDPIISQDILQDVFIQVYTKINKLNHPEAFESWLYKITVNFSLKYMKKCKAHPLVLNEEVLKEIIETNISYLPEDITLQTELTNSLLTHVYELPADKKTTIILYYYNNLPIKDIAQIMNCSEGTVKSRLFNSKKMLEKKLLKEKNVI